MRERILEFLQAENKSSIRFAEEIGVQPSGISHILSGRNNPSLDFILKMLGRYKYLSTDWLLFGKGTMYKDGAGMQNLFEQTLFDQRGESGDIKEETGLQKNPQAVVQAIPATPEQETGSDSSKPPDQAIERIIWFYSDGSFIEYFPRK